MRFGLCGVLIASFVLFAAAPSVRAGSDTATMAARAHYAEGQKRYNLGDYKFALDEFRAAYLAKPDPAFLFNIAQCLRQLGDYGNAEKSYRAYLRESPQIPDDQREQVRKLIAEMERAQAESRAKQPPTGTQPPHDEAGGVARSTSSSSARPSAATLPKFGEGEEDRPRPWYAQPMGLAGLVLLPVGAVLVGVGGGLVGHGGSLRDDAARTTVIGDRQQLLSDATTNQNAGYALIGVGAAVVVTGAVLTGISASRRRPSVTLLPSSALLPSSGGGLVLVGGEL